MAPEINLETCFGAEGRKASENNAALVSVTR
jgi:hypothetical protein